MITLAQIDNGLDSQSWSDGRWCERCRTLTHDPEHYCGPLGPPLETHAESVARNQANAAMMAEAPQIFPIDPAGPEPCPCTAKVDRNPRSAAGPAGSKTKTKGLRT